MQKEIDADVGLYFSALYHSRWLWQTWIWCIGTI